MRFKKVIAALIIISMCAGVVTIYWYFKQTQKTAQTPINKGINLKKIDYNKDQIKDFNYTYFKQGKKCFILKAKEHSLGTDQRSDLKTVDLIVFDEQGKENYTIHAGEGIISNKRDFVLLRAPVEIRNSKGWKVTAWLANYYPEEDRMEIRGGPPRISWEEKNPVPSIATRYFPSKKLNPSMALPRWAALKRAGKALLISDGLTGSMIFLI